MTLRNVKSNRILEKGTVVFLSWYDYPNGGRYLAKYRDKYYYIIDDGTSNEFFHSHAPKEITEKEAKRLALKYNKLPQAIEKFGWKEPSDDEIDDLLGL